MKYIINRIELYERLWAGEHLESIAFEYGMTKTNLKELCKFLKVPVPTDSNRFNIITGKPYNYVRLDYWKDVPDNLEIEIRKEGLKTIVDYLGKEDSEMKKEQLSFLESSEKETLISSIEELAIKYGNAPLCKEAKGLAIFLKSESKSHKYLNLNRSVAQIRDSISSRSYRNRSYESTPYNLDLFSKDSISRVVKIFNLIYLIIKELGGAIDSNYRFIIRDETIYYDFYGMQDSINHLLTKDEQRRLNDYKKNSYYSEPHFRKLDYIFNGRIAINIYENYNWRGQSIRFRDSKNSMLENQIIDIIIALYEMSETEKLQRLEHERKKKEEQEKEEARKLYVDNYNNELEKTQNLILMSQDYNQAQMIRNYLEFLKKHSNYEIDDEWIKWAYAKADWIDPSIEVEDEYFGEKELGKNLLNYNKLYK